MPIAGAHLAAQLLASQQVVRAESWTELRHADLVSRLLRVPGHDRLLHADVLHLLDDLRGCGEDPVFAAAHYLINRGFPLPGSDQDFDLVRIARSVIPSDIAERFQGTSRRILIDHGWSGVFGPGTDQDSVADAHVHSGGVSPPLLLLRTLLRRLTTVPANGLPLELVDSDGVTFRAEPLLLALGIAAVALESPQLDEQRLVQLVPELELHRQQLWDLAFELAGDLDAPLHTMRASYATLVVRNGGAPDLLDVERTIDAWLHGRASPLCGQLARGCMGALTLLHAGLTCPAAASLDIFVDRFALLRSARDLTSAEQVDRIAESVRFLLSGGRLSRLELRTTTAAALLFHAGEAPLNARERVVDDIRDHARAIKAIHADHRDLAVQMPVTFLRHRPHPMNVPTGYAPLREPLRNVLRLAQAVASLCYDHDTVREFIGSLDVVGRELDGANWLFSLGYSYVDRALRAVDVEPLSYSLHAGEQFPCPLDGLRRIGEVQLFDVDVERVGHALALSARTADLAGLEGPHRACEVLESLLWSAWTVPELRSAVESSCMRLSTVVFRGNESPTFDELIDWYTGRFSYDRMQALGVLPDPRSFLVDIIDPYEQIEHAALQPLEDRVDRMLAASLIDKAIDGIDLNTSSFVPDYLTHDLAELMDRCYQECRAVVAEEFKGNRLIESCPSSNVALAGVRGFARHPVGEFKAAGLRVTMSSDDPGLFGSLVEEEILSTYGSRALGVGEPARRSAMELRDESLDAAAPGLTSERCGELVAELADL